MERGLYLHKDIGMSESVQYIRVDIVVVEASKCRNASGVWQTGQ